MDFSLCIQQPVRIVEFLEEFLFADKAASRLGALLITVETPGDQGGRKATFYSRSAGRGRRKLPGTVILSSRQGVFQKGYVLNALSC